MENSDQNAYNAPLLLVTGQYVYIDRQTLTTFAALVMGPG